ncbi:MAG: hypothetical protein ACYDIA_14900 [Candidatus Humimicrobiaceae bacterium]
MQLPEKILIRPKECFELLKECLIYFSIILYNDFNKTETAKLPLYISEAFKQYSYEDFKGLLKAIGIKDIREAYISFKRLHTKPNNKLNEKEKELLERTLKWFDGQITKIPMKDQKSQVEMYIKKLGHDYYRELYEAEANKFNVNAVEFLIKVLPNKLKEYTLLKVQKK